MNDQEYTDPDYLAYDDGKVLFKLLVKMKELNLRYYINAFGVILTYWQGGWSPYHEVMKTYPAMNINK